MRAFADWLREHGLDRYAAALRDADVDFTVVRALDDADLRELGLSIGDRKRFLAAVAALDGSRIEPGTERRQLTVLFCDLVGSVAIAERLDPEALRDLIQRYRTRCAHVIARYDGHVARYVGDGILAYFGWPQAHEDDAERAVRAALELLEAIKEVRAEPALALRVGIATGPVVVGHEAGESDDARLAVGTTPNLAARLQGAAAAGEILIAPATRRLVADRFELEDRGAHALKGVDAPVPVHAVRGVAQADSRFAALHGARALVPLVGRAEELELLRARWRLTCEGEGQVVMLSGEAGIGKSRLAHALLESLGGAGHAVLLLQCSPYHGGSPLYPVIDALARARDARVRSLELERLIDGSAGYPPTVLKDRTFGAFASLVTAAAPVVILLEDMHWADSTTLELFDYLVPRLLQIAALLIGTFRPEFAAPWAGLGNATLHTLNRLTRRQSGEMVRNLADTQSWPPVLLDMIVANADGVPLFIEELTHAALERGADGVPGIPATLMDSLTARLDRLGEAKEIAQLAACIGREFRVPVLAAASDASPGELERALERLVRAQIVFRRDQDEYAFKHALARDAAYQSLVTAHRARHHERIATALEARFPEEAAARPEIVAFHFERASAGARALEYWQRAGEAAMSRSSYVEAIGHFESALAHANEPRELAIRVKLGPAYQAIKGMASAEAGRNYERACALVARQGESPEAFRALWGDWLYRNLTGRRDAARERADELVALADRLGEDEFVLQAHHARWTTFVNLGELATTRLDIEAGLRLYDRARHRMHADLYGGHDPGVCCRTQGAMCFWVSGQPERADRLADEGIALARSIDHPFSLAIGLWFGGAVKLFRGKAQECLALATELGELAARRGFKSMEPHALFQCGWARFACGEADGGLRLMEEGEARLHALGQHGWRHICLATIAEAYATRGETARALERVETAIELARHAGIESWRPELLRRRAVWMLELRRLDRDAARAELSAALELARHQSAGMFELRAAASLACLDAGDRHLLERCLASLDSDSPEFAEARALLGV